MAGAAKIHRIPRTGFCRIHDGVGRTAGFAGLALEQNMASPWPVTALAGDPMVAPSGSNLLFVVEAVEWQPKHW